MHPYSQTHGAHLHRVIPGLRDQPDSLDSVWSALSLFLIILLVTEKSPPLSVCNVLFSSYPSSNFAHLQFSAPMLGLINPRLSFCTSLMVVGIGCLVPLSLLAIVKTRTLFGLGSSVSHTWRESSSPEALGDNLYPMLPSIRLAQHLVCALLLVNTCGKGCTSYRLVADWPYGSWLL